MADTAPRLLPSLMDRLLDPDSMGGRAAGYDHARMAASVRADLEDLLNARRSFLDIPPEYPEAGRSILAYGLPDLSGVDPGLAGSLNELARTIRAAIERHEPRLRKVRVAVGHVKDKDGRDTRDLMYRIEGELNIDPAPEVGFETVVQLTTGKAKVEQKDRR